LPLDDAALGATLKRRYDLLEKGWKEMAVSIAQIWRPWRTIACWYLYKYHKLMKNGEGLF